MGGTRIGKYATPHPLASIFLQDNDGIVIDRTDSIYCGGE